MTEASQPLTLGQKVALLLEALPDPDGQPYSVSVIAETSGISDQTLLNILSGHTDNPRIDTLRRLCQLYRVSLDYFVCPTKGECRTYLSQKRIELGSPVMKEIAARSEMLSDLGKQNVLTLLGWAELSLRHTSPPTTDLTLFF